MTSLGKIIWLYFNLKFRLYTLACRERESPVEIIAKENSLEKSKNKNYRQGNLTHDFRLHSF